MADAIAKFLVKSTPAERQLLIELIAQILADDMKGLSAKKLVGHRDVFRVRKGVFRIVYKKKKTDCTIIHIDRRSEKTYRDF